MKNSVLITLAIFFASTIQAQSTFIKGYMVNEKGDTLQGEVKVNPKREIDNYNKLAFKDATGAQKMYKPAKVRSYGYADNRFITMESEGEQKFFKVLVIGPISLYKLVYEGMRMNAITMESEYVLINSENNDKEILKENKFKRQLNEWMRENVSFLEAHNEEKKFDEANVVQIIKEYNSWKASK